MKVVCPVCGVEGILEVRDNSRRVLHYKGFVNGRKVYEKHKVEAVMGVNDGSNGNKSMGIKKINMGSVLDSGLSLQWARSSVRLERRTLNP